MTNNCNRVQQEGRCDAAEWVQCTYCRAIDDEPCKDNQYKPIVTYNESGKALVETCCDINLPADYSFATVNDFIHSHDRTFEELQALCLGMSEHISKLEKKVSDWMDISTAPKDGTEIICRDEDGDVSTCFYQDDVWHRGWVHNSHRSDISPAYPKSWMNLPPGKEENAN